MPISRRSDRASRSADARSAYAPAVVRRDEAERGSAQAEPSAVSRCASPTGASPVPVGAGAPGSRSQVRGEIHVARAGRQEPLRREQERGPQHEVNPAASKEKQCESRAAHVMAKATLDAPGPGQIRAPSLAGVRGAARAQGHVRNTRDPSALPSSRQARSYKPKAKSGRAQRESEGFVVPLIVATKNAAGGKGPCFGHARSEGKREGMAAMSGPNYPDARTCDVQVRQPQRELWAGAERRRSSRQRANEHGRGDARPCVRGRGDHVVVQAPSRRPSASRVREIRKHGLKGGSALSPMNDRSSR
jgi:hypothetical protein